MLDETNDQKPISAAERQRSYHRRMRELGYTRLSVWVPEVCKAEFDEAVIRLQEDWARRNLMP